MPKNVDIKDEYQRLIKNYSDKTSEIRFRFTKSHSNFLYFFNNFGDKKGRTFNHVLTVICNSYKWNNFT